MLWWHANTSSKSARISVYTPGMTQTLCWGSSPVTTVVSKTIIERSNSSLHSRQSRVSETKEGMSGNLQHAGGFLWHLLGFEPWIHPQVQTIKTESDCDVRWENIRHKRLELWHAGNWLPTLQSPWLEHTGNAQVSRLQHKPSVCSPCLAVLQNEVHRENANAHVPLIPKNI